MTPALSNYPAGSIVKLSTSGGNASRAIFTTNTPFCRVIGVDLTASVATTCHVAASLGNSSGTADVQFVLAPQSPLRISNKVTSVKKNSTIDFNDGWWDRFWCCDFYAYEWRTGMRPECRRANFQAACLMSNKGHKSGDFNVCGY
jgi:hypothetical protein